MRQSISGLQHACNDKKIDFSFNPRQSRPARYTTRVDPLRLLALAGRRFRAARMRRLLAEFNLQHHWTVLDVGGTPAIWQLSPVRPRLVILNTPRALEPGAAGIEFVQGDGCALPFPSQCFDLVFSNSVIEHVGSPGAMRRFASEVRRVGRRHFIQTPDAAFPIEPHLYTPFLHQLPRSLQRRFAPRLSLWSLLSRATPDQRDFYIRHFLEEIRLLHADELQALFPGSRIVRERFLGLGKSLIACGGPRD